jgi:cytoskeletal protein CcmA (bactofilin family)
MVDADKTTLIDANANVEGKLTGKDAHILGRFQGEIQISGRLLLGEGSRVDATVRADAAEIAGDFKGELHARSLVLLEKARVEGSLEAQTLAVREGAHVNGSVNAGDKSASRTGVAAGTGG